MNSAQLWQRYCRHLCTCEELGFSLDISRMDFDDGYLAQQAGPIGRALDAMCDLERGGIANPDENRMVGHYWLRAPELAPNDAIRRAIEETLAAIKAFAADVHCGASTNRRTGMDRRTAAPPSGGRFENLLLVGIGGSALGPQFLDDALRCSSDPMRAFFLDNTDPDGFDRVLGRIAARAQSASSGLGVTLTVIVSKSGGTKETRNAMLEVADAYRRAGLDFAKHAVAVSGEGSQLCRQCHEQRWLAFFPMWDWVGGRTSVTSAVGLLPAALQGFDVDSLLAGARTMDIATRRREVASNPAALLALMWYRAACEQEFRDMVVIPYKDRLSLFARYLQQLVMESVGKAVDLDGERVHQGLTVYGNKGSTDQHAYVQQLRDGLHNFFATFVEVLSDRAGPSLEVDPGITSGDYLHGFLQGTRQALYEKGRGSITITVKDISAQSVGALIALYERAVGFYASLVNVNAYHQPGVEAGKVAAEKMIAIKTKLVQALEDHRDKPLSADRAAQAIGEPEQVEAVFKILEHLSANPSQGVSRTGGPDPLQARFAAVSPTA